MDFQPSNRDIACEGWHDHDGEDLGSDAIEETHEAFMIPGLYISHTQSFLEVMIYVRWNKSSKQ